ncbi:MAG: hypothetical protein ACW976_07175 [Candidatus Ranarchaeia archaeon]|jgi:hypothetical protein
MLCKLSDNPARETDLNFDHVFISKQRIATRISTGSVDMKRDLQPKIDPLTPQKPFGVGPGGGANITPLLERLNRMEHTIKQLVIWIKEIAKALNLDLTGLADFPLEKTL